MGFMTFGWTNQYLSNYCRSMIIVDHNNVKIVQYLLELQLLTNPCCTPYPFQGIGIQVDHSDDGEVAALFDRIKTEQKGKLDVVVNNAYAGVDAIASNRCCVSVI